jgi:hypothetical protein
MITGGRISGGITARTALVIVGPEVRGVDEHLVMFSACPALPGCIVPGAS